MKMPTKFVETLSPEEHSSLVENHQTSENFRLRNRSHAILLSFEKYPIAEIARICRVDRDTVSGWIDNWNELGEKGLEDGEKPGRPLILSLEDAQSIEKETVIVFDNAPIHRSEEFAEKIEEWEELGLKIYFLPAYCPSLNKIEMLWEKIKYDWLSWEAYSSYKNLCHELDSILSQIGSKYPITFS